MGFSLDGDKHTCNGELCVMCHTILCYSGQQISMSVTLTMVDVSITATIPLAPTTVPVILGSYWIMTTITAQV